MKTIHRYSLAAALCLMCCAACTDAADDIAPDAPPTAQAIRFAAVRPAPLATRAVPGDTTIFWPEKSGNYTLAACYPPEGTYDIADQSTPEKFRQADFLEATERYFAYAGSTPVNLHFRHALAKVRMELTGVSAASGEIKTEIRGYTTISLIPGGVPSQASEGYITACRDNGNPAIVAFEAMVAPAGVRKQDFLRITIGDKVYHFTPDADIFEAVQYLPSMDWSTASGL